MVASAPAGRRAMASPPRRLRVRTMPRSSVRPKPIHGPSPSPQESTAHGRTWPVWLHGHGSPTRRTTARPQKALVALADGKDVFVLLDDDLLVRAQTSLDVIEIAYPGIFLRVSRELLVPIPRVTAIEALPCARGATPHRLLTIKGLGA